MGRRMISGSVDLYARSLNWTLRRRWLTLTVAAMLTVASFVMYQHLPKGFLPTQDTGIMQVRTLSRSNISFEAKLKSQQEIAATIASDPAVEHVGSYIGVGPMSVGSMLVSLKPLEVRKGIDREGDCAIAGEAGEFGRRASSSSCRFRT